MSLSGSVGWAESAVKSHPQNIDGGVAIEILSVSFYVHPYDLVLFGIDVVAVLALFCSRVSRTQSQYKYQCLYQYQICVIRGRNPMGHAGDGEGGPSSAARASDKSLLVSHQQLHQHHHSIWWPSS